MFRGGMRRRVTVGEVPVCFDDSRAFLRRADSRGRPIRCNKKKRTGNGLCPLLATCTVHGKAHCPVRGNILKVLKRVRGRRKVRTVMECPCCQVFSALEHVKCILRNGRNRNISKGGEMCRFRSPRPLTLGNKKQERRYNPYGRPREPSPVVALTPLLPRHELPGHNRGFRQDLYQRKPAISL